jgi:putative glycerol-1-phosphate prenyltransferase
VLKRSRHLFKLDPARPLDEEVIYKLSASGTDGIIIGGTDRITYENTLALYEKVRKNSQRSLPVFQEISSVDAILHGVDGYLIPLVLNAQDPYWLLSVHQQAIKTLRNLIPWEKCQVEGYIILNEDSKVAQLTKAKTDLTLDDVLAYGCLADEMLRLPYVYIEYSGKYGNPTLLKKLKNSIKHSHLIYGGGIDDRDKAVEMSLFADTIVVGNIIYEDLNRALNTVIKEKNIVDPTWSCYNK